MKKNEVEVGKCYQAKISGKLVVVRILSVNKRKGTQYRKGGTSYTALNLSTGREVGIRSAAKLRKEVIENE